MSEMQMEQAAEPTPGLTQMQRLTSIFSAPSKTFEDIEHGNRSWWMPFLIMVLVGYMFFAAISMKVGWAQVAQNVIHANAKAEDQMQQLPEDQRAMRMKFTQYSIEGSLAATPVIVLIVISLGSLVLWGTINFIFGGKAQFGGIFAAWMYAGLPGIIKSLLAVIVLFAGMAPESFNLNNPAPTNIGAFLSPTETNAALYRLASALDFTTIWSMVLLSIGLATVAKVKRSSGYLAVFGWWAIIVVISVGWTLVTG
ncbi:MAG: YIP1 family protein [Acidobacteriota bacterium]|nr:YIP1 family protein [Acidobacteriota bacterium]